MLLVVIFWSLPRGKTIEYRAVVTEVDADLDDDALQAELENINCLKLTRILLNKETHQNSLGDNMS